MKNASVFVFLSLGLFGTFLVSGCDDKQRKPSPPPANYNAPPTSTASEDKAQKIERTSLVQMLGGPAIADRVADALHFQIHHLEMTVVITEVRFSLDLQGSASDSQSNIRHNLYHVGPYRIEYAASDGFFDTQFFDGRQDTVAAFSLCGGRSQEFWSSDAGKTIHDYQTPFWNGSNDFFYQPTNEKIPNHITRVLKFYISSWVGTPRPLVRQDGKIQTPDIRTPDMGEYLKKMIAAGTRVEDAFVNNHDCFVFQIGKATQSALSGGGNVSLATAALQDTLSIDKRDNVIRRWEVREPGVTFNIVFDYEIMDQTPPGHSWKFVVRQDGQIEKAKP